MVLSQPCSCFARCAAWLTIFSLVQCFSPKARNLAEAVEWLLCSSHCSRSALDLELLEGTRGSTKPGSCTVSAVKSTSSMLSKDRKVMAFCLTNFFRGRLACFFHGATIKIC